MAGLWCTALGWGDNELAEAAAEQMRKLAFGHLFAGRSHEPAIALAEKLKEVAPFPVSKVFFANSGSRGQRHPDQAVLVRQQCARARPRRRRSSRAPRPITASPSPAASLTGLPANHSSFDLPLDFVRFTDCPHYYRNAEAGESEEQFSARMAANLETLIEEEGPETIAAMIAEPLQGAGGVILPPQRLFRGHLARCCRNTTSR